MPKKSTSKSKISKKSPSRLDRVIKKFNLTRPRNQFIVAFLVVGLLGGGYFAYQSFAAEGTRVGTYNLSSNNMVGSASSGGVWEPTNDCLSKNCTPVLLIDGPAFAQAQVGTEMNSSTANSKKYITCAMVKAYVGSPYIILYGPGSNNERIQVKSGGYQEYCTPSGSWSNGQVPSVLNNTAKNNVVAVSAIYVNEVSGTSTPAPAPTK